MRSGASFYGRLRSALLLLAALPLALAVSGASAETPPQLTSMAVSVMPEYDQPSVFVSYRGELNEDVALPLPLRVRLPGGATIDHACSMKPDNEHVCHPFTIEPDGDYSSLSYEAITNVIYIEFHYGAVSGAGGRDMSFDFWPPFPVQQLDLFVQEPMQASEFELTPAADSVMGEGDFRHHSYSMQEISPDEPVSIQMSYSRPTDEPSVQPGGEQPAPPRAAESSGGISQTAMLVLGLLGAAVLGGVLYFVLTRRLRLRAAVTTVSGADAAAPAAELARPLFCRRCGQGMRAGAGFCTTCGQPATLPGGDPQ